mmetsp:Transcript_895/g.1753  ORF Transcript_895/g.1753 Transcript_895/m.1753 type:complete len:222 (-) Transcript_895:1030-1695(-)
MQGALVLSLSLFLAISSCGDGFARFASKIRNESRKSDRQRHVLLTAPGNRVQSRRWNGGYKTASKRLADVPKKKKMKLDLVANGVKKTLEKKRQETLQHVLTKAVIWKLFMDEYPNLEIEVDIKDRDYLPDVVDVSEGKEIAFWGEAGRMKVHKAVDLMQRYPDAHIVHIRWGMNITHISQPLEDHFCSLPLDVWRFIDDETGVISVEKEDLEWKELSFPQ